MLTYGQTGSGKTHTIAGVLDRMPFDLFRRKKDDIRLFLSFYELLGDEATDLLDGGRSRIEVMEDVFGKINAKGATEVEVGSARQLADLCAGAMHHRRTQVTFKNDSSSRSHAVCAIRAEDNSLREAEDGCIFVINLADSQFHNRSLVRETRLINWSLMALKECIRNCALSAVNPGRYYHIPYRLSKLTLLLKDTFEVESHRQCKTVVIACVSPSVADISMTMGTLRYTVPIKIGQLNREKAKPNPKNPATWSNAVLKEWVHETSGGAVSADMLCPHESGMQLLRVPETEFICRVMEGSNRTFEEKRTKAFYTSLWKLLIDARTAERKAKLRPKKPFSYKDYQQQAKEWLAEHNRNEG